MYLVLPLLWQEPLSFTSLHFVSRSVYLSHSVSHLLFHHTLHLLHSFYLSLFLYYSKLPQQGSCVELSPHVSRRTWYQFNRSALSRERSDCLRGSASLWSWLDEDVWDATEPKVKSFLKKSQSVFNLCNTALRMSSCWYSICALLNIVLLCKNLWQRTTLAKYFVYWS